MSRSKRCHCAAKKARDADRPTESELSAQPAKVLQLGDFAVETKAPWGFKRPEPEEGTSRGAHGSTREMQVPLLIAGAGVRVGAVPKDAKLVDVAPTIAALLGVRPPVDAQGRALAESLNV